MRQDISALDRLREETEDVVYDQECALSRARSAGVRLHAIDCDILALSLVALGLDWRYGAASVGLLGGHLAGLYTNWIRSGYGSREVSGNPGLHSVCEGFGEKDWCNWKTHCAAFIMTVEVL